MSTPAVRERFDLREVARDPALSRLLVVRVGPGWFSRPADARRSAAEQWLQSWRHASPQGIVAIVDAATGHAVVNFDAHGGARLAEPPASTVVPDQ